MIKCFFLINVILIYFLLIAILKKNHFFLALGRDVADFISQLLVKDPRKRLGGGDEDAAELKRHPFFKNLDWEKLARKEIPAPFKPVIR